MSTAAVLASWLLVLGQWAGAIGAIVVVVLLIVKASRKWNDMLNELKSLRTAIGKNGDETVFDCIHHLQDQVSLQRAEARVSDQPKFRTDPAGFVTWTNRSFRTITGWTSEEIAHGRWRDKLDRRSRQEWDRAVSQKEAFERWTTIRRPNSLEVTALIWIEPVTNVRGQFLGWVGAIDLLPMSEAESLNR